MTLQLSVANRSDLAMDALPYIPLPPYLREYHIRRGLRAELERKLRAHSNTVIIDEFRLFDARIDLAVINGSMHGYEIKSEADNLDRLERQIPAYNAVFNRVTAVVAQRHCDEVT